MAYSKTWSGSMASLLTLLLALPQIWPHQKFLALNFEKKKITYSKIFHRIFINFSKKMKTKCFFKKLNAFLKFKKKSYRKKNVFNKGPDWLSFSWFYLCFYTQQIHMTCMHINYTAVTIAKEWIYTKAISVKIQSSHPYPPPLPPQKMDELLLEIRIIK